MSGKQSAGLLVYRVKDTGAEVLLGHMGGPFWSGRDAAAWSIPKGEQRPDERPQDAARREFQEELGLPPPDGPWIALGEARQRSGKTVTVWAVEGDLDPALAAPGTFRMEWPRGSGVLREFPELDRVAWFSLENAVEPLVMGQRVFLDRLSECIGDGRRPSPSRR
ncbi:NUDIX domain-containing protein [Streptomyces sp. 35G-GA-8]|uniref:NUDIX domain-containing protein n=1 Tax=Streptomyces sp. 35G-GA-8 TaxID=2939434 RepID=UPI00201EC08E|nr:NUDIX domain-containing protein [Streptomyces sp. 35G-GA-8]MCL7377972.1 NUDIX domain-containing protein [Streptomyces sp. 35G-GA-8]